MLHVGVEAVPHHRSIMKDASSYVARCCLSAGLCVANALCWRVPCWWPCTAVGYAVDRVAA
jgi:hypothetical protein